MQNNVGHKHRYGDLCIEPEIEPLREEHTGNIVKQDKDILITPLSLSEIFLKVSKSGGGVKFFFLENLSINIYPTIMTVHHRFTNFC